MLQGGVVAKRPDWRQPNNSALLSVEDPQQPGRDIASPSVAAPLVQEQLERGFERLAAVGADQQAGASTSHAAHQQQRQPPLQRQPHGSRMPPGHSNPRSNHQQQQQQQQQVEDDADAGGWAAVQADGQHSTPSSSALMHGHSGGAADGSRGGGGMPLLSSLLDVAAALGRDAASHRAREAFSQRNGSARQAAMAALRTRSISAKRRFKELVLQGDLAPEMTLRPKGVKVPKKQVKHLKLHALADGRKATGKAPGAAAKGADPQAAGGSRPKYRTPRQANKAMERQSERRGAGAAAAEVAAAMSANAPQGGRGKKGKKQKGGRGWTGDCAGAPAGGGGGPHVQHNSRKWAALQAKRKALKATKRKAKAAG